jgi:hypothetical protein
MSCNGSFSSTHIRDGAGFHGRSSEDGRRTWRRWTPQPHVTFVEANDCVFSSPIGSIVSWTRMTKPWFDSRCGWLARCGPGNCSGRNRSDNFQRGQEQFYLRARFSRVNPLRMLSIDPRHRQLFAELGLNSFESVTRLVGGGQAPNRTTVLVKPTTLAPPSGSRLPVFYKQYELNPASWAFIGRCSKACREFQNYAVFTRLGIACAERLACGEGRDWLGRLRRAFILTRAIPGAMTLTEFLAARCPNRSAEPARRLRDALRRQLAAMVRTIHDAGFFHRDLFWRNILVTWQAPAEPRIWWIDCPRGQFNRWSPWRHRQRLKDLASLDKSASQHCTRGERLAFIRDYLGKSRPDATAKQLACETLAYRKRRWPEDWNE